MKLFLLNKFFPRAAEILLGGIFLLAAFSKIGDLTGFHETVLKIDFLPFWMQGLITLFIPSLELVLGMYLLALPRHNASAFLSLLLMVGFTLVATYLTLYGRDCGCFKLSVPIWMQSKGGWVIFRDIVFVAMAFYVWTNSVRYSHSEKI